MYTVVEGKPEHIEAIQELEKNHFDRKERCSLYDIAETIWWGHVLVIFDKDKLIGYLLAMPTRHGETYSAEILTHKEYRKQNIASALYYKLFEIVPFPIYAMISTDNVASLKLHEKLGFQIVETIDNAFGDGGQQYLVKKLDAQSSAHL